MASRETNKPSAKSGIDELTIPSIPDSMSSELTSLEIEMYENWRDDLAEWAHMRGKNPLFGEGYSASVVESRIYQIDDFSEWVFNNYAFTTSFQKEMANAYWNRVLLPNDNKLGTNRKRANSIQLIYKKRGDEWNIPNSTEVYQQINKKDATGFTDWLRKDELDQIKHASLRAYATPNREEMTADEEEEWAAHIAQQLRKPRSELTDEDWENRANSYKIPSMVYVSCDVGFRPAEIERARVQWFKGTLDEGEITIPKEESTKNSDNWHCALSDESVRLMRAWLDEREKISKYENTDEVWLTREGNPYDSDSLRRPILQNLMDEAGIDRDHRESGWYMIRRGIGTKLGKKKRIEAVMSQLRITSPKTAKRYIRHDTDSLKDWLNNR